MRFRFTVPALPLLDFGVLRTCILRLLLVSLFVLFLLVWFCTEPSAHHPQRCPFSVVMQLDPRCGCPFMLSDPFRVRSLHTHTYPSVSILIASIVHSALDQYTCLIPTHPSHVTVWYRSDCNFGRDLSFVLFCFQTGT